MRGTAAPGGPRPAARDRYRGAGAGGRRPHGRSGDPVALPGHAGRGGRGRGRVPPDRCRRAPGRAGPLLHAGPGPDVRRSLLPVLRPSDPYRADRSARLRAPVRREPLRPLRAQARTVRAVRPVHGGLGPHVRPPPRSPRPHRRRRRDRSRAHRRRHRGRDRGTAGAGPDASPRPPRHPPRTPRVLAAARARLTAGPVGARCDYLAGDFADVPPGGDVYLLSRVLHDWDDDRCRSILRYCADAMSPDADLLIVERLLPTDGSPSLATAWDLHMMCNTGGQERTADHYARLLSDCGLRLVGHTPLPLGAHTLHARPAERVRADVRKVSPGEFVPFGR
ncbi:methyltransferase [Streptomyces sp. NPDC090054]|uniref:methyltransferase n=1 Tax=Streptomyces sp. NPDC090054 TaxID=3365933 RepID=UPI0037FEAAFD